MNSDEINRVCKGLISGLFKKAELNNKYDISEPPEPVLPIAPMLPEHTQINTLGTPAQYEDTVRVLTEIRDALKESNVENRDLTHSTLILSYVAFVVALAVLGEDIWSGSGLPLFHLRIAILFLIIGGIAFIYWLYKKKAGIPANIALIIGIACLIGGAIVFLLVANMILTPPGIHPPTQTTGNITNICENCTYPVTNTVNNYNVTIIENCTAPKSPMVSVEEINHLMVKGR